MKKTNLIYWIFTGLFAAFMLFTAVPDLILVPEAVVFMNSLGYPAYFTVFIGVAKTLGAVALVVPGFPRIKEWAYAGLFFDLIGAVVSVLSVGMPVTGAIPILVPVALGVVSYIYHHKRLNTASKMENNTVLA